MAVRIRLKRLGRANRAFWRICATDKRAARDGRVIEELGHYDPLLRDEDKVKIHRERVVHWLQVGASPSKTVTELLAHLGLDAKGNEAPPRSWKKKKKGPPPKAAERVAVEKAKAEEEAAPDAAEEAAPAGDAPRPGERKVERVEAKPEPQTEPPAEEAPPEPEAEAPAEEAPPEAQPDEEKPADDADNAPDEAESAEPDAASHDDEDKPTEEGATE